MVPYHEIGQYGGTAFIGRMSRLNWSDAQMIGISYEPVTRLASDHRTVLCNVCESWQMSDDAQTVTIRLRPGMRWSDGDSFDADDLMFWYQDVMLNEELTPRQPRRWAPGGSFVQVNKVDDHTVTLNFAAPFPNWAPSMATTMGGDMLLPRHYLEGFHPGYTDRGKLEARAKEEGFESWTKYFGQTRQSWATIVPRYNPDLPTILPFYPHRILHRCLAVAAQPLLLEGGPGRQSAPLHGAHRGHQRRGPGGVERQDPGRRVHHERLPHLGGGLRPVQGKRGGG